MSPFGLGIPSRVVFPFRLKVWANCSSPDGQYGSEAKKKRNTLGSSTSGTLGWAFAHQGLVDKAFVDPVKMEGYGYVQLKSRGGPTPSSRGTPGCLPYFHEGNYKVKPHLPVRLCYKSPFSSACYNAYLLREVKVQELPGFALPAHPPGFCQRRFRLLLDVANHLPHSRGRCRKLA